MNATTISKKTTMSDDFLEEMNNEDNLIEYCYTICVYIY